MDESFGVVASMAVCEEVQGTVPAGRTKGAGNGGGGYLGAVVGGRRAEGEVHVIGVIAPGVVGFV